MTSAFFGIFGEISGLFSPHGNEKSLGIFLPKICYNLCEFNLRRWEVWT